MGEGLIVPESPKNSTSTGLRIRTMVIDRVTLLKSALMACDFILDSHCVASNNDLTKARCSITLDVGASGLSEPLRSRLNCSTFDLQYIGADQVCQLIRESWNLTRGYHGCNVSDED